MIDSHSHLDRCEGEPAELAWLSGLVEAASPGAATPLLYAQAEASFPGEWRRFERRWQKVRAAGMLGV